MLEKKMFIKKKGWRKYIALLHCLTQDVQCANLRRTAHNVADRQILFKKSLMVFKHPYGSPEVPYTSESQNPLLEIF